MKGVPTRVLLAGGVAAIAGLVASCASQAEPVAPSKTAPLASPSPSSSQVALPQVNPWRPSPNDVKPEVKLRAAQLIETIGTWQPGDQGIAAASARVRSLGLPPVLARQSAPLVTNAPAAITKVTNVQYGGILETTASTLITTEQWLQQPDGSVKKTGTTFDVWLRSASPRWEVTAVYPAQPKPPARRQSALVKQTLTNPRIKLPYAAAADIRSGTINDKVLRSMNELARDYTIDVSVVESGHPLNVFGTDRMSNHPEGLAVDIWAINGRPVIDPRNRALVERVMRRASSLGPYQVGGPVDLDGGGLAYFSDDTHRDHLHLGFHP